MILTSSQVKHLLHGNDDWESWVEPMQELLPKYGVNTEDRIAMFVAQCGHESLNFKVLKENLNYSANGLNAIFPKYFERAGRDAQEYHRQPEKIANIVYASRMGNGPPSSGDGWKFSGKGVIQLTGFDNVSAFAKSVGMDLDDTIEYLGTKRGALESACWFWDENNLNRHADAQDVVKATKKINGGTIGLADRKHHYKRSLDILGGSYVAVRAPILLKVGSTGKEVERVQSALGLETDGVFGIMTQKAVQAWQESKDLVADGIVGPKTYNAMLS